MREDLKELRKIAEQATQDVWYEALVGPGEEEVWIVDSGTSYICSTQIGDDRGAHDSIHIATFDPPTVLALLSRLEQAEENLESALEANKRWAHRSSRERSELFKAEQAVARVREVATGDPTEYGWSEAMLAVLRTLDGEPNA